MATTVQGKPSVCPIRSEHSSGRMNIRVPKMARSQFHHKVSYIFSERTSLAQSVPPLSYPKLKIECTPFACRAFSNLCLRLKRNSNSRRFYSSLQHPSIRSRELTSSEKEKLSEHIKNGHLDKIEEIVKAEKASSLSDITFFIGRELYDTAQHYLSSLPPEKLEENRIKIKKLLTHAEKHLSSSTSKEARELLAKVYYALGNVVFPKNNYEAVYYYNQALKNLSYKPKVKSLPDYDWDVSPIDVLDSIPDEMLPEINAALGKAAFLEGNLDIALNFFKRAVEQDPKNVDALVHKGCIAWMRQGFAESGQHFDKAFSLDRVKASKLITEAIVFTLPHILCRASLEKKRQVVLQAPVVYPDAIMSYSERVKPYDHLLNSDADVSQNTLEQCQQVFHAINDSLEEPRLRHALTAEILLKEVAFHSPKRNAQFLLPPNKRRGEMLAYKVDEVIRLGGKIPAYGLISSNPEASPMLIYRGTAPALSREGGFSSLIEDFDPQGVARTVFKEALPRLNPWLEKVTRNGKKARILGYSQGASLAALTLVHSFRMISRESSSPSITFNPPGIDLPDLEIWEKIPDKEKPYMVQYLVEGDIVSRCGGTLIGEAYEIATAQKLRLLDAHISLVLPHAHWKMYQIDLEKDNQAPLRQFAAGFVGTEYGLNLYQLLKTHPVSNFLMKVNDLASNPSVGQGVKYALKLGNLLGNLLATRKNK